MTAGRPASAAWEWPCIAIVVALLGAVFALTQPLVLPPKAHDGTYYLLIAQQLQAGLRPETIAPFVLRVGTSWLAASLVNLTGVTVMHAFFTINIAASVVTVLLFALWLRDHVFDAVTRVTLVAFFLVAPYSPFRFTFYYPQLTDPFAMLFLMIGLLVLDRLSRHVDAVGAVALTLIVAIGCVFRELVAVLAVAAFFVRPWTRRLPQSLWRVVPLAGVLPLFAIQSWVIVRPSPYSIASTVERWLAGKGAAMMVVAFLFVFGPLSILLLQHWRTTWRAAIARPDLVVFAVAFIAAGWLGASDTERIFQFAVPVVLMLIGTSLAGTRRGGARDVFAVIVAMQLLGYRVFVPIDGRRLPFFSEHYSFYTTWVDVVPLYSFLVFYLIAMVLIVLITRSAPFAQQPAPSTLPGIHA
jgi:hypothetical protein